MSAFASQTVTPVEQPPAKPVSHARPASVGVSSRRPSQSLSIPSQSSSPRGFTVATESSQSVPRQAAPKPKPSPSPSRHESTGRQAESASDPVVTGTQSNPSPQSASVRQTTAQTDWPATPGTPTQSPEMQASSVSHGAPLGRVAVVSAAPLPSEPPPVSPPSGVPLSDAPLSTPLPSGNTSVAVS